jgi:hypothetical protein
MIISCIQQYFKTDCPCRCFTLVIIVSPIAIKQNIMAELELNSQNFEIRAKINRTEQQITVSPDETTDGVEFFNCILKGQKITQLRETEQDKWDQMWGELDQQTVNEIGAAINKSKS